MHWPPSSRPRFEFYSKLCLAICKLLISIEYYMFNEYQVWLVQIFLSFIPSFCFCPSDHVGTTTSLHKYVRTGIHFIYPLVTTWWTTIKYFPVCSFLNEAFLGHKLQKDLHKHLSTCTHFVNIEDFQICGLVGRAFASNNQRSTVRIQSLGKIILKICALSTVLKMR